MNRSLMTACLAAAAIVGSMADASRADDFSINYKQIKFEYVEQDPDGGITFGGGSTFPALPADFFAPGSLPFDGYVKLSDPKGDDIAPDKIIRKTGGVFPDPPAPVDIWTVRINLPHQEARKHLNLRDSQRVNVSDFLRRAIPIEIVSLNLISAEPIIVNYSGGATELWDAQVELDPSAASQGLLQITHNPAGEPDGGVMNDGYIDILGTIKFTHTPAGGEPRHRFFSIVDRTQLTTTDAKWAHQHSSIAGGANREFIPGADPANPSAPLQILLFQGGGLDLPLRVMDVVPEPSSMMLVSLGSLALIAVGFRRRF